MKTCLYPFFALILCALSCSKESNSTNADSNSIGTGGSLARFIIVGNYLYIANATDIRTYDISNSGHPVEKDITYTSGNVETIFSYNNNLFLGASNGMFIYSLQNPAKPEFAGQAQHFRSCDPVVANDSLAWVTLRGGTPCGPAVEGLYAYTVKDITSPQLLSTLEMSTPSGLALYDTLIYVCRQNAGLSVVDVSHAEKPVLMKTLEDGYFEDAIAYDHLLICYVSTGIRLYDISNAGNPVFITTIDN